jgi:transposase
MRFTVSEKQELIDLVVRSDLGVNRTLREIGLNKSTFYKWYKAYSDFGVEGLEPSNRSSRRQWNSIPQEQKNLVVELALERPELSSRELAYHLTDEQQIFISESSVYRILKNRGLITSPAHIFISAGDEFTDKTKFVHRYNNERYHESLNNLTPADVYYGRGDLILKERAKLKSLSLHNRRMEYQQFKLTEKSENAKNSLVLN